uniref:Uncharacterized protein n=1 Tax=Romanomermis culicivorax TaxID=13658 RepID=A0A915IBA8_ROMCU
MFTKNSTLPKLAKWSRRLWITV